MAGAAKRKEVCVHAREEKAPLILERALAFDDVSAMNKADVEGY